MKRIYLDNNATTPIDPRVLAAMQDTAPANPSSVHSFGRDARNAVTRARRTIADALNVRPSGIIFTSGGTEALNLSIRGLYKGGHLITSAAEHIAVLSTIESLNAPTTILNPTEHGAITPQELQAAIRPDTSLIALMAVNNETGVKTDLPANAAVAHAHQIPLVVDAVAALGKEPLAIPPGVSAICFSGHKFHGPPGTGFAIIRPHLPLTSHTTGGPQEASRRGGTENVPGITGLAKAITLLSDPSAQILALRTQLESGLLSLYPSLLINGTGPRICNTLNAAFPGRDGEALLMNLDLAGIAVSHGSACSSGSLEPSRVLLSMGLSRARASSSLRFSLSRLTTPADITHTLTTLSHILSSTQVPN